MNDNRIPYHKPRLEKVSLVPQEAVLGGCKTTTGGGSHANPGTSCVQASCVDTNYGS
jgi:hypothetical protein